jgi:ParB-like nuclease family protein
MNLNAFITGAAVYKQLSDDFPDSAIRWTLDFQWGGPKKVELSQIDFSNQANWAASEEPDRVAFMVDKIKSGDKKPIILVLPPNQSQYMIVDGHHRALAYKELDQAAIAYTTNVPSINGPWEVMHNKQRERQSG